MVLENPPPHPHRMGGQPPTTTRTSRINQVSGQRGEPQARGRRSKSKARLFNDLKYELGYWTVVGAVLLFVFGGVTVGRVVLLVAGCFIVLAWLGVALYRRARKPESARSAAERRQSDKPKGAEAAGDAPAKREARALRILKSDLTLYVLGWFVAGAGWILTRGVTVGRVVLLVAGCFVVLGWLGVARYWRARKSESGATSPS